MRTARQTVFVGLARFLRLLRSQHVTRPDRTHVSNLLMHHGRHWHQFGGHYLEIPAGQRVVVDARSLLRVRHTPRSDIDRQLLVFETRNLRASFGHVS